MCSLCLEYESKIIAYQLAKNERAVAVTRKIYEAHKRKHADRQVAGSKQNYGGR